MAEPAYKQIPKLCYYVGGSSISTAAREKAVTVKAVAVIFPTWFFL